ncbi:predicted protein [Nematostella vectensis]|uniref:Myb/SANT-like DNA-binding domain-containing protein n=1 Tax=Nematostella vectensis TaxID=45351 RepID=A7RJN5_NEMVE|nr:predicted protein [Nematostella vectensis]|eukprot:XP_001640358.1 predicted protein [Nematostella vectensis]
MDSLARFLTSPCRSRSLYNAIHSVLPSHRQRNFHMANQNSTSEQAAEKQKPFEWSEKHDECLIQEVLTLEPFKEKKGSIGRGRIWEEVSENLNSLRVPIFKVNKRSVRERFQLLSEKYKKMSEERKASGIETDQSEVERGLEEVTEKEKEVSEQGTAKSSCEKKQAEEMRRRAMEGMARRKREGDDLKKTQKSRGSGRDTTEFLKEKTSIMKELKEKELEIQARNVEAQERAKTTTEQHATSYASATTKTNASNGAPTAATTNASPCKTVKQKD